MLHMPDLAQVTWVTYCEEDELKFNYVLRLTIDY